MVNIALLEEIGLTKAEAKVYLALLELGSCSSGKIVEKSRASSSKIYEILEKLMQKGLVSFVVKSGVKYFEAASPKRILDYMEEKRKELDEKTRDVEKILPELELKQTLSKYSNEATVYKGMKGLETAFQDLLKTLTKGDTNYVFVVGALDERLNEFFKRQYQERAKCGIKTKTIFSEAGRKIYESRKNFPYFEGRVIGTTISPATVNIYGSKVNLRMGDSTNALCIVIDNKELADSFLEQFNVLWNQETFVTKGMDDLISTLKQFIDEFKPGDTFDVLGAAFGTGVMQQEYAKRFTQFHQYRLEKGVRARWLFQQGTQKILEKYGPNYCEGEIKFLPYTTDSPVAIFPKKDKTLLVIQDKEPTIITLNNKKITTSFERQFESLWNQKTRTFEGIEQTTSFFSNILNDLKAGEEYFVINGNYGGNKRLGTFFKSYHKERHKRGIKANLLFNQNVKFIAQDLALSPCEVKFLPPEFQSPLQMTFYKNKLYISIWSDNPVGFFIEQQGIVDVFKSYFDQLWNQKENKKK